MKKIAVAIAAFALALTPTTANAHSFDIYQGKDYAHINQSHTTGWIRDKECDGDPVAAMLDHGNWVVQITDSNGCSSGGTEFNIPNSVENIRVCERDPYGWENKCSPRYPV